MKNNSMFLLDLVSSASSSGVSQLSRNKQLGNISTVLCVCQAFMVTIEENSVCLRIDQFYTFQQKSAFISSDLIYYI